MKSSWNTKRRCTPL